MSIPQSDPILNRKFPLYDPAEDAETDDDPQPWDFLNAEYLAKVDQRLLQCVGVAVGLAFIFHYLVV